MTAVCNYVNLFCITLFYVKPLCNKSDSSRPVLLCYVSTTLCQLTRQVNHRYTTIVCFCSMPSHRTRPPTLHPARMIAPPTYTLHPISCMTLKAHRNRARLHSQNPSRKTTGTLLSPHNYAQDPAHVPSATQRRVRPSTRVPPSTMTRNPKRQKRLCISTCVKFITNIFPKSRPDRSYVASYQ